MALFTHEELELASRDRLIKNIRDLKTAGFKFPPYSKLKKNELVKFYKNVVTAIVKNDKSNLHIFAKSNSSQIEKKKSQTSNNLTEKDTRIGDKKYATSQHEDLNKKNIVLNTLPTKRYSVSLNTQSNTSSISSNPPSGRSSISYGGEEEDEGIETELRLAVKLLYDLMVYLGLNLFGLFSVVIPNAMEIYKIEI